ncbi:MAG: xanthine dehydrogenase family protein molybdopterin-binding subunit [Gemmatimonadota bacterium]|nr:xanthine dehydrogenase family protein molybdopterin-binding subunit [Gemmatimonadota bacterium]
MSTTIDVSRRDFLRTGATAGAGLVIAFSLPVIDRLGRTLGAAGVASFEPNGWFTVGTDGIVTIFADKAEMGQGVMTALPMIVAEELDADWANVRIEFAKVGPDYQKQRGRGQGTGGSTSVRTSWDPLRKAGAQGREMLVAAAAQKWSVDASTLRTGKGKVFHDASGRSIGYGDLANDAATMPVPATPKLKDAKDYTLVGTRMKRVDVPQKTDGTARFGIDVKVPGMLVATVARCSVCGGKVKKFDATKAKTIKGVRDVVQISSGVAVIADGYWPALQGKRALDITWDEGEHHALSSSDIAAQFKTLGASPGSEVHQQGDVTAASAKTIEAEYHLPFLAHASMEPMNCTADVRADSCEVWAPTQGPTATFNMAQKVTGLSPEKIQVHSTFLGGGFGRRSEVDFVQDAVEVSKAIGKPVKVMWSREDDMQHDFYRPASLHRFTASLDASGAPVSWTHHVVAPSVIARRMAGPTPKTFVDGDSVAGTGKDFIYAIPNRRVEYTMAETPVPVGFWRSVGHSQNAFVLESFIDEVAHAGKQDPIELRRKLLADKPRHLGVLNLAVAKANEQLLPKGRARGVAVVEGFGSFISQVAEVSVDKGAITVHRVVCAVDCGRVINPDTVEAQIESGIVYGLTAALKGEIALERGRVKQSNFHDYRVMRLTEMPQIEVYIVPSTERPGGIGEPGTPPIAPAVANAVFSLTGKRLRQLPLKLDA